MGPVTGETAAVRSAREATRGSAIKLAAEVASRLVGLGTTLLLARGLGVSDFGALGRLWYVALILAEAAEFGLQATASRALVAGSLSLRALVAARLATSGLVAGLALASLGVAPVLAPLVLFFVLAGWGEFLGVALRCRGARVQEAVVLLLLRGGSLAGAAAALAASGSLPLVAWSQAVSPLPAIGLGAVLFARRPGGGGGNPGVAAVLREAVPLAVNGALQMLSPRVELLVLSLLAGDRATGVFLAALRVLEFLGMVPSALAQGAMPSLVREALEGGESVRRRTATTMALLGAPAAAGLALVAVGTVGLLYGPGYADAAVPLALLALALPALFLNALVSWSLLARGRASWLPRLTLARVGVALALALVLVPSLGPPGAAAGLAAAEWLLLVAGAAACRRAEFALPVAGPLARSVAASVPMALVVGGLRESLLVAVPVGALTWGATLAAARAVGGGAR